MSKPRMPSGVSLVEVVVSTLLIGGLMAAALTSVGAVARSTSFAADSSTAVLLARQLMDEIIILPYEDTVQTPVFGLESGESTSTSTRTQLDDLDDYLNWNDSPPRMRQGTLIDEYSGWLRTADVQKLSNSNYSVLSDSSPDSGIRLVTVQVTTPAGKVTTMRCYRTKPAGALQSQGVGQTVVTWVGVGLQTGSSGSVSGGTAILNHAGDQ